MVIVRKSIHCEREDCYFCYLSECVLSDIYIDEESFCLSYRKDDPNDANSVKNMLARLDKNGAKR